MTSPHDPAAFLPGADADLLAAVQWIDPRSFAPVLLAFADRGQQMLSLKESASGRYVYVNARMAQWFGKPAHEIIGRVDADLVDASIAAALKTADLAATSQTEPLLSEHRLDVNGHRHQMSVMRMSLAAADGAPSRFLCSIWSDLSAARHQEAQLQRALKQLEQQQTAHELLRRETQDPALRDEPTGLYQRAHFEDQFRREADLSSREHREFALVSVALDPPSEKALPLGELASVRVLEALGQLLRGNTRAMDASCRLDSTHFAVLLSGVGLATAHARMEGLRRQCATQIVMVNGQELGFTVSMGVASFPHTANSQDGLLQAADLALAEAQRRGGNTVALAAIPFEES